MLCVAHHYAQHLNADHASFLVQQITTFDPISIHFIINSLSSQLALKTNECNENNELSPLVDSSKLHKCDNQTESNRIELRNTSHRHTCNFICHNTTTEHQPSATEKLTKEKFQSEREKNYHEINYYGRNKLGYKYQ